MARKSGLRAEVVPKRRERERRGRTILTVGDGMRK